MFALLARSLARSIPCHPNGLNRSLMLLKEPLRAIDRLPPTSYVSSDEKEEK
jgi:hypothetical protein